MGKGAFLTLEGIDGTGKTTQARLLAQRLRGAGREVVETREPGGAPGAEQIRRLVVEGAPGRWSAVTEALLFTAARRDHVERVVAPALGRGAVVICDRYVDSTRAYQGEGEGRALVDRLHDLAIGLDPDLTLVLDMDPAAALSRAEGRTTQPGEDRFERKGAAFQFRLRAAFQAIAAAEPDRCAVIDADRPAPEVAEAVWAAAAPRLGLA
ncbi:MAG TPA: dTMP kinase [Thermohalobaculum sp.]|nr:dTMP kinase [Thermohalobaculum sp.]